MAVEPVIVQALCGALQTAFALRSSSGNYRCGLYPIIEPPVRGRQDAPATDHHFDVFSRVLGDYIQNRPPQHPRAPADLSSLDASETFANGNPPQEAYIKTMIKPSPLRRTKTRRCLENALKALMLPAQDCSIVFEVERYIQGRSLMERPAA
jgi:hypothetical protein